MQYTVHSGLLLRFSNTPPQAQLGVTHIVVSFILNSSYFEGGRASVMMSTHCDEPGINSTWSCLFRTFSRRKKRSNSTSLVRACKTGLWARAIVFMLSQYTMEVEKETPSLLRRDWSHSSFVVVSARDLYSASVVERDTTSCFFAHQETKLAPKKTQAPDVEPQLASPNTRGTLEKWKSVSDGCPRR